MHTVKDLGTVFGIGCVDLWSTETGGEPIYHYQTPGRIQVLSLSPDSPVLISATGSDVRLDCAKDCGYWRTVCQTQLPKTVSQSSSFLSDDTFQCAIMLIDCCFQLFSEYQVRNWLSLGFGLWRKSLKVLVIYLVSW